MGKPTTTRLLEMLEFRRPAFTVFEEAFIDKFIMPYHPDEDTFGNLYIDIGENPNILWSSHTDTVHHTSGLQQVQINKKNVVSVVPNKESNCLGADCTTGVWIMLEMIDAKVKGRYIFHRDEESGGHGSKWVATNNASMLKGIDVAIAFDRKGTGDIITEMGMDIVCSDEFADSLATVLGGTYKKSNRGMFTDTKNYRGLVPECTNISVGYEGAHSPSESQDLTHVQWLRDKMIKFDSSSLVIKRTPSLTDRHVWVSPHYNGTGGHHQTYYHPPATIFDLVKDCPTSVSKLLVAWGVTFEFLQEQIEKVQKSQATIDPNLPMLLDKKAASN